MTMVKVFSAHDKAVALMTACIRPAKDQRHAESQHRWGKGSQSLHCWGVAGNSELLIEGGSVFFSYLPTDKAAHSLVMALYPCTHVALSRLSRFKTENLDKISNQQIYQQAVCGDIYQQWGDQEFQSHLSYMANLEVTWCTCIWKKKINKTSEKIYTWIKSFGKSTSTTKTRTQVDTGTPFGNYIQ